MAWVEQLGGPATPAVGFAMGLERLCLLLQELGAEPELSGGADIYLVAGEAQAVAACALVESLRDALPATEYSAALRWRWF